MQARTRLANWYGPSYEVRVDVVGEVRMANMGPGKFMLQVTKVGPLAEGRFDADQEAFVLEALKAHCEVRLRVAGLGEFSTRDKQMRRFARIDRVQLEPAVVMAYDEGAPAIWNVLSAIGDSAPEEAWADVPADLSTRIDEMVCAALAAKAFRLCRGRQGVRRSPLPTSTSAFMRRRPT